MRGRWGWKTEHRQETHQEVETETQKESRREALICPITPSLTLCRAPRAPTLSSSLLSPPHVSLSVSPDSDSKPVCTEGKGKGASRGPSPGLGELAAPSRARFRFQDKGTLGSQGRCGH